MERFIKSPNLPRGRVSLGIVDGRVRNSVIESLEEEGVHIIKASRCCELYEAVSCHPDMLMHHLGGKDIIVAPNCPGDLIRELLTHGFNIIKGERFISGKYPLDVAYNVARIGEHAVCNAAYTDSILLSHIESRGVKIINVRQGYAKCSICIVNDTAVITSDEGINKALIEQGLHVLLIRPGSITLEGLDYGFIGGASGYISEDTIAFAGNIKDHPDYSEINEFLLKYGKKIKILDAEKLLDVGTFLPLKEYI